VRKIAALNQPDPETGEIKAAENFSAWENEFLTEVEQRLDKYGSAFHDLSKGRADDALSMLQSGKLKEIAAKARGKKNKFGEPKEKPPGLSTKKGFTTRKPLQAKKGMPARRPPRQIEDE
jgi:hypothetical protein